MLWQQGTFRPDRSKFLIDEELLDQHREAPGNWAFAVNGKRVALPGGAPQVFVVTSRGIAL